MGHQGLFELARFTGWQLALPGLGVDDLRLHVGERHADRADLLLALPEQRVAVRHRGRLGEPVTLDELRPGELDEPAMRLAEERRRSRDARLDRTKVVLLRERRVVDRVVDARRAAKELRTVARDVSQHMLEVELRLE